MRFNLVRLLNTVVARLVQVRRGDNMLTQLLQLQWHFLARLATVDVLLIAFNVRSRQRNGLVFHPRRWYVVRLTVRWIVHLPLLWLAINQLLSLTNQRLRVLLIHEQNNLLALVDAEFYLLFTFEWWQVHTIT